MYCPRCSKEQVGELVRFCSGCGFLLTGVAQILTNVSYPKQFQNIENEATISTRKKGLKNGLFLFLSAFLVIPLLALITSAVNGEPFFVAAAAIITFCGGTLRMIYALMFESKRADEPTLEQKAIGLINRYRNKKKSQNPALYPQQAMPASTFVPPIAGNWRESSDLAGTAMSEEPNGFFRNR